MWDQYRQDLQAWEAEQAGLRGEQYEAPKDPFQELEERLAKAAGG